jgi:hypothetical protein
MAGTGLRERARRASKRENWGYVVWGVMGVIVGAPEISAAIDSKSVPWSTISGAVGNLEYHHSWVALVVVVLIVFVAYYAIRYPPWHARHERGPRRTRRNGRVTMKGGRDGQPGDDDDEEVALTWIAVAIAAMAIVSVATFLTLEYSDSPSDRFHPAYVLYGLIGLFWIVLPSAAAFFAGKDVPFPPLVATIRNLEHRLGRFWGPFAVFVILAGLVILLLHLTLYPFPDISHILNPMPPTPDSP